MAEGDQKKYDVLEKIGHGSFGIIRKVRRRADGMVLCRKEISYLKMSQKEREQLHAEFQILSTLRHANIVGYYHREHLKTTQDLHLYMEYCGNGDLGRVIRDLNQKNQYAEESFVWSIFAQLVTALYRCHYGVDPPDVGKNVLGLGVTAKPKVPAGGVTILHRDLKPENVFLGEDNSVKLGDFGLAKMIQSHDFASTYVGTPFYMSPEICAAEKYTLKSDIWSLGCIIYELCAREPPFNAKSHYQLVQKIKEGKLAPLPVVYSPELCAVVRDCLKVNPDRRPDTAALLNLPVVRLMRKEKEVVEMSRLLKTKEEQLGKRQRELERRAEADKAALRQEIDASVRREWEVKARLEIDRLVNAELDQLQKKFEEEVRARVDKEVAEALQKQQLLLAMADATPTPAAGGSMVDDDDVNKDPDLSSSLGKSDYLHSSIGEVDFPSTTDLTELSMDESCLGAPAPAPTAAAAAAAAAAVVAPATAAFTKRQQGAHGPARTPFGRAQTMFAGTPMDVEMASPSPMAIASLSLSPRRNAATKVPASNPGNIFAAHAAQAGLDDRRWHGAREASGRASDSDSEGDVALPSPTRLIKSRKNPFAAAKKQLLSVPTDAEPGAAAEATATTAAAATAATSAPVATVGIAAAVGGGAGGLQRPGLASQKSAPVFGRVPRSKGLDGAGGALGAKTLAGGADNTNGGAGLRAAVSGGALRERGASPTRRLSKIPSAANLGGGMGLGLGLGLGGSDAAVEGGRTVTKKTSFNWKENGGGETQQQQPQPEQQQQAAAPQAAVLGLVSKQKAGIRGRTLVELQQARAGGRPLSAVADNSSGHHGLGHGHGNMNISPKRPFREHAMAANRGDFGPPAVWDPEQDEMPSPFLVRRKVLAGGVGGGSRTQTA